MNKIGCLADPLLWMCRQNQGEKERTLAAETKARDFNMVRSILLLVAFLMLASSGFGDDFPEIVQGPNTDRVFGPRFSQNVSIMLSESLDRLNNQPVRMLCNDPALHEELELSEGQLSKLQAAREMEAEGRQIMKSVTGSSHPSSIGSLSAEEVREVATKTNAEIKSSHEKIRKEITGILTNAQLKRFEQIYRQKKLLRRKLTDDLSGFGWEFTPEQQAGFQLGIREAERDIAEQIYALRYVAYAKVAAKISGEPVEDLFGEAFVVEIKEPEGKAKRAENRRRRS